MVKGTLQLMCIQFEMFCRELNIYQCCQDQSVKIYNLLHSELKRRQGYEKKRRKKEKKKNDKDVVISLACSYFVGNLQIYFVKEKYINSYFIWELHE